MKAARRRALALALALLPLLAAPAIRGGDGAFPDVKTDAGIVRGTVEDGVRIHRGIPYAAPPVGELRWKPPQPVVPWEGVRSCVEFGAACPQPAEYRRYGGAAGGMSEDCLYLNVFAPVRDSADPLPVLFWIHGGGFTIGAGSLPFYDGRYLAKRGVVVVTINYRLGPFGFFAHPLLSAESEHKVSGNYGLLDQIAALRWVRTNIAAFGGDPGRVTIFGESAGAVSVSLLMVSPLSKRLFHGAIAESGGVAGIDRRLKRDWGKKSSAEARGRELAKALGCDIEEDPLAALRERSWEEILEAADPVPVAVAGRGQKYGPVVDGYVLPDDPVLLWAAGRQHDVPFIAGSNADDGNVFSDRLPIRTKLGYRLAVKAVYGEDAEEILKLLPPDGAGDVRAAARKFLTVSAFVSGARFLARCREKVESPGRLYHFTRIAPIAGRTGQGAAHGFEIPYVFGLEVLPGWIAVDDTDRRLSERMQECWVNFAATGDPNPKGRALWPLHTTETDVHLEFGDRTVTGEGLFTKECDLFHRLMMKRR